MRPTTATTRSKSTTAGRTRRLRRVAVAPMAVAALTAAGLPLAATADAETEERRSRVATSCLWAGATYPAGATVAAGGTEYSCGTQSGQPHWNQGARTASGDTVRNPGARANPVGQFSSGARQPGTSYTDYCVGNQLIPGTDDVYKVVRVADGSLIWKAATPVAEWTFDGERPEPTWRTVSMCYDGNLT
ncbi:hypothetical protein [Nocardia sp. NPDC020380]|uniref:hypothetical protein n=1 Tax=Nocardia sp. NPDC020380 TaxID=3364309 RepID=UPI0037B7598F